MEFEEMLEYTGIVLGAVVLFYLFNFIGTEMHSNPDALLRFLSGGIVLFFLALGGFWFWKNLL